MSFLGAGSPAYTDNEESKAREEAAFVASSNKKWDLGERGVDSEIQI